MKLIILAAWKWTRMRPITHTTPKPLIKICWKSIIEHNLENLYKYVNEIIIVVKHLEEKIMQKLWNNYKWVKISYHKQENKPWTWAAIMWISSNWDDVLIINWDSIFGKKDLGKISESKEYWALVKKIENPSKYWVFKENNWYATEIVEKPNKYIWNLTNIWVYKFSSEIFNLSQEIKLSSRNEYEITDIINLFIKNNKFKLINTYEDFIDIWCPEDIEKASKIIRDKILKKPEYGKSTLVKEINWLELHIWIPENLIEKLIEYSQDLKDKDLQKDTSDKKRFSTKKNTKNGTKTKTDIYLVYYQNLEN